MNSLMTFTSANGSPATPFGVLPERPRVPAPFPVGALATWRAEAPGREAELAFGPAPLATSTATTQAVTTVTNVRRGIGCVLLPSLDAASNARRCLPRFFPQDHDSACPGHRSFSGDARATGTHGSEIPS